MKSRNMCREKIILFLGSLIAVSGDPRIIGGVTTTIEKHPWQVSIQFFGVHACGGSIISDDTILTAAHCVTELLVNLYEVVPGATDLTKATLKIQVKESIVHDEYNSETYDNDIAVLKLKEKLTFSDKIQPIALPSDGFEIPDGTALIASGWGVTQPGTSETSAVLREVVVDAINWTTCKQKFLSIAEFTDTMICAGVPEGGKDTCEADSGGALELNGVIIGIVSWGQGCGEADYPGVYTRVSHLRSWILENTGI